MPGSVRMCSSEALPLSLSGGGGHLLDPGPTQALRRARSECPKRTWTAAHTPCPTRPGPQAPATAPYRLMCP